jgi:hypothetical protein
MKHTSGAPSYEVLGKQAPWQRDYIPVGFSQDNKLLFFFNLYQRATFLKALDTGFLARYNRIDRTIETGDKGGQVEAHRPAEPFQTSHANCADLRHTQRAAAPRTRLSGAP